MNNKELYHGLCELAQIPDSEALIEYEDPAIVDKFFVAEPDSPIYKLEIKFVGTSVVSVMNIEDEMNPFRVTTDDAYELFSRIGQHYMFKRKYHGQKTILTP